MNLASLHWREPLWLLLALYPLLWALLRRRQRRSRLAALADPALQPWVTAGGTDRDRSRLFRHGAWALAWLLLAIAAAGPREPQALPGRPQPAGLTVMVVLDVSRSMQAADVAPRRDQRARIELHELLDRAAGTRFGLLLFAGRPHLFVPPTFDHAALRFYLRQLDGLTLPTRGSRLADALALAGRELATAPRPAAVLLITDGDPGPAGKALSPRLAQVAASLGRAGTPLYILGLGSEEGAAIPLPDGGWLKAAGRPVITRLNTARLQELARLGGGRYREVADDASDWRFLFDRGIARLAQPQPGAGGQDVIWREDYPLFLFPAILLLFLAVMPWGWPRLSARHLGVGLVCLLCLPHSPPARAATAADLRAAYAALRQGDFADARDRYARLTGYAARLGEGACRYRLGDLPGAIRQFGLAVLAADTDRQRATALYDLANSHFRRGDYARAARLYADALRYRPDHRPSRRNRALSERLAKQVAARLRQEARAGRTGRGPRRGTPASGLRVDDSASLTLGDETATPSRDRPPGALPEDAAFTALVEKGLERARLAATGRAAEPRNAWRQDLSSARFRMRELRDTPAGIWQRLFAMEEGFPAVPDAPRPLPGVPPW